MFRTLIRSLFVLSLAPALLAQWDPANAQWGKSTSSDLRVMSWNVEDGLCRTNFKLQGFGNWDALARITAAMQPDVLILQECSDNSGNGTGSGVDSISQAETVIDLFFHGGTDPFLGGAVTSYVQLYAPTYDLPHVFVSGSSDGFNRNIILSRYPFADINADGIDQISDFFQLGDLWSPGTNGGIRGFGHAEIDLPDATYAGDVFIGNSHLKAGGSTSDRDQRRAAAQNISYYMAAMSAGLGTPGADPNGVVFSPPATALPSAESAWILGGDWNEDESTNGQKGPAEWITRGSTTGGTYGSGGDGPDRDGSDMVYDAATEFFTGNPDTLGGSKLDYLAWQDSIVSLRRAFIFNSAVTPLASMPPEVAGFAFSPTQATGVAADHRPVICDLIVPLAPSCNDPTTDLGNGLAGAGGLVPVFSACGELGTGDTATFFLDNALPSSQAFLVLGLTANFANFSGGVLVPAPTVISGALNLDASGSLVIPNVPGGGGPFDAFAQFVVLDPAAPFGRSLSNALQIPFDV